LVIASVEGRVGAWALVVLGVLLAAVTVGAAEPSIEVRLTPRFGVEDRANLEVRIVEPPTGVSQPELGELTNLQVVGGPSRGTEFSFINGVATSAVTFSYLVRAKEAGPASVGPVTVAAGKVVLRAEAVTAEVVPGSVVPPSRGRRTSPFFADPFEDLIPRRRSPPTTVVLRHLLASRHIVVGEPVMATLVLDTNGRIDDFNWITAPSYPGWWAQRVEPPEQITPEVVEVEGTRYNRFVIARHALIPLKAGVLTVPQVKARLGVGSRSLIDPGDVMDRTTDEIEVQVDERPPPPTGYTGAVGQLRYTARLEPTEVEFGGSAVLAIELEGSGNLPLVEAPSVWPECDGCEVYPPEEGSRVAVDERGIQGSRSWNATVVPRRWGELVFEPVEVAVFDPRTHSYRPYRLGPLALRVLPPPPTPTPATQPEAVPPEVTPVVPAVGRTLGDDGPPEWLWILGALIAGVTVGGIVVWLFVRRRTSLIPPRRPGQTPAERARELQVALERWWLDARARRLKPGVEEEMQRLRRDLEAVRFAPGRADHSETIIELEDRLHQLLRRA
jgi:hypothetical protein